MAHDVTFKSAPEYKSVEAFVEFCLDDETDEFSAEDLQALNYRLRKPIKDIRRELEGFGLRLAGRQSEKRVRGFTTSSLDRWYGPGACKTHGGSGGDQITGFAGRPELTG